MTTSLAPSVVTTRDPKGLKFVSIVEAAYNGARLSEEEAQRVNDTPGLSDLVGGFIAENRRMNRFANEEVRSSYVYPPEYKGPKPIGEQIAALSAVLNLNPDSALEYARNLPDLKSFVPEDALPFVGWFAFPRAIDIGVILEKIADERTFYNYRSEQMDRFRILPRTAEFIERIAAQQGNGDILVAALQLGMRHRGRSVRRAREVFLSNEFGITSVIGGAVTLVHPTRFVRWEQLHMDIAGEEFDDPDSDVRFGRAPIFRCPGSEVGFDASRFGDADDQFGSASGFLPQ